MTEETKKETEEKQEVKKEGYQLVQIPTEHRLAVQTPKGEVITQDELLVNMANDVSEIKKGLVG